MSCPPPVCCVRPSQACAHLLQLCEDSMDHQSAALHHMHRGVAASQPALPPRLKHAPLRLGHAHCRQGQLLLLLRRQPRRRREVQVASVLRPGLLAGSDVGLRTVRRREETLGADGVGQCVESWFGSASRLHKVCGGSIGGGCLRCGLHRPMRARGQHAQSSRCSLKRTEQTDKLSGDDWQ